MSLSPPPSPLLLPQLSALLANTCKDHALPFAQARLGRSCLAAWICSFAFPLVPVFVTIDAWTVAAKL